MLYDGKDRRKYERINTKVPVFIETVVGHGYAETGNILFRCETLDISAQGLKVWVPLHIPQGGVLNISVPGDDLTGNLELVGESIWVENSEVKSGYWVGLELKDTSPELMKNWFNIAHQMQYSLAELVNRLR